MPSVLVIVESPAKCKKIEGFLGAGYKCMASFGHIRELAGLESIDTANDFKPTFQVAAAKRQQVSKLRRAAKAADRVVIATDDDREGEAIGWHLCEVLGLRPNATDRIIFHEITKPAVQRAMANPGKLNMAVVGAQKARQILDMLVGYKVSPVLWDKLSKQTKAGLSAGRCQTPALRLVYDNQQLIDASPGKEAYKTTGYFTSRKLGFELSARHTGAEEMEAFLERSVEHEHIYDCSEPKQVSKAPPRPFTTSRLQQTANNELRYSPADTMRICQKLYEGGHITYMRTDSETYSKEFAKECASFVEGKYGATSVLPNLESVRCEGRGAKAGAQEAHEAIRVTKLLDAPPPLQGKEKRLYLLIERNTIASCMAAAVYQRVVATVSSADEDAAYSYGSEAPVTPGWHQVVPSAVPKPDVVAFLRSIKKGSVLPYARIESKLTLMDVRSHYTEAGLVKQLERRGIGRPSTFSSLVAKIQERNYVKRQNVPGRQVDCTDFELVEDELTESVETRTVGAEKNKLVMQPLGKLVIEFLTEGFDQLFAYDYTAAMEERLDEVAARRKVWHSVCDECNQVLEELTGKAADTEKVRIRLDDQHTYLVGKYGPVIKKTAGKKTTFLPVREGLDMNRLRNGGYTVADVVGAKRARGGGGRLLGKHGGQEVRVLDGRYGPYVQMGDERRSIRGKVDLDAFQLTDAVALLQVKKAGPVRVLADWASIRTGPRGDYVFLRKPDWPRPKFVDLKPFTKQHGAGSYKTCDASVLMAWLADLGHS